MNDLKTSIPTTILIVVVAMQTVLLSGTLRTAPADVLIAVNELRSVLETMVSDVRVGVKKLETDMEEVQLELDRRLIDRVYRREILAWIKSAKAKYPDLPDLPDMAP